eukprot:366030-Chlamydomonas_euryale.AAC.1
MMHMCQSAQPRCTSGCIRRRCMRQSACTRPHALDCTISWCTGRMRTGRIPGCGRRRKLVCAHKEYGQHQGLQVAGGLETATDLAFI